MQAQPFGHLGDFDDPLPSKESIAGSDPQKRMAGLNDRQFRRLGRQTGMGKGAALRAELEDDKPLGASYPKFKYPERGSVGPKPAPKRSGGGKAKAPPADTRSDDEILRDLMPEDSEQEPGASEQTEEEQPTPKTENAADAMVSRGSALLGPVSATEAGASFTRRGMSTQRVARSVTLKVPRQVVLPVALAMIV
jgi:hypothetical protein